jgi:hypothetical protein
MGDKAAAADAKLKGNKALQEGNFEDAIRHYTEVRA